MGVCTGALTDEIKALKLTIFMFRIYSNYYHVRITAVFHYYDAATECNQHCC